MSGGEKTKVPAGPSQAEILAGLMSNPVGFYLDVARKYGDLARIDSGGGIAGYFVSHPDCVKYILQDNFKNFPKGLLWGRLKQVVGEGLLTSEGDFWRRQRRLMQPYFYPQSLSVYVDEMIAAIEAMLARWEAFARRGEPIEVASEMMDLSLEIIARVLMGSDLSGENRVIKQYVQPAYEQINRLYLDPFYNPNDPALAENNIYKEALFALDKFIYESIHSHRLSPRKTLLARLIQARHEDTEQGMTDRHLRDEIITLFLAGHETTGNALAWTWYLLSRNPEAEKKLRAEIEQVLSGRTPGFEDLQNLRYTVMVLQESLRLYPPVWMMGRRNIADDAILGFSIPANAAVNFSQYVTHRLPAFWEEPEAFVPERFAAGAPAGRPRYAYFPFGGGAHQCIGNSFALIEGQLVLSLVLKRYHLSLVPGHMVEPFPLITLIPRHGLRMILEPA